MQVKTTYELERETHKGCAYHQYELELSGDWQFCRPTRDDPGDNSLTIDGATCGGEVFELTPDEERKIVDWWLEDLTANGPGDEPDYDDRDEDE